MQKHLDPNTNLLFQMKRIRLVEEAISHHYAEQEMRCPVHLSIGQEAVAVGVCSALTHQDFAVSTHRAHAHYLAKGGSLNAMIAELYGKVTGCARGRAGSMHLIDSSVGFMGSTGIVGNSIPLGVGLGFSAKLDRTDQVSCVFLGDAAMEEGVAYESLNFAAVKRLPVLFICENNTYSVYSHIKDRQPVGRKISELADAIGVPSTNLFGNDVTKVSGICSQYVSEIRQGGGPRFLELYTQRLCAHCGPSGDYEFTTEMEQDIQRWKSSDPIIKFEHQLLESEELTSDDLLKMQEDINTEVDAAFRFAKQARFPDKNEIYEYTYAE